VRTLTFLFLLGAGVVAGRAATAEAQAQAWTTYGKICPGSEIQDILVRSEDELWFACRLGGVKKSLDGGRTAVDVSGGVKDTDVIRLADTPLGLVAGALNGRTGRQGVYLLPPGATKWNRGDLPTGSGAVGNVAGVAWDPATKEVLAYALAPGSGNYSAYASKNGKHFSLLGAVHTGLAQVGMWRDNENRFWAGTEGAGQWMSSDNARTWTRVGPYTGGRAYIQTASGDILFGGSDQIYKWDGPGTTTWKTMTETNHNPVTGFAQVGSVLYAATYKKYVTGGSPVPVLTSVDNGDNWTAFGQDDSAPIAMRVTAMRATPAGWLLLGMRDGTLVRSSAVVPR